MNRRLMAVLVEFGLLVMAGSPSAHHSTSMYDSHNPVTITGIVKKFEWTNTHAFIYLEVKDEKTGKLVEWEVEMMSLNHLRGYGWTSKTVKPGLVVRNRRAGEERCTVDDRQSHEAVGRA